jgi:hypothetical protein
MPDVNIEKLQAASRLTYGLDYPGGMRVASGLNLDPNGICRALYGKELNACFAELLGDGTIGSPGLISSHALLLDGTSGCWCTTPDAAVLDILGDIDIRIEYVQFPFGGINQTVIGKWGIATNQRSYKMHTAFGLVGMWWSTTGTDELNDGQEAPPTADRGIRTILDVVNGANHTTTSFSSASGLGLGTQFATHTTGVNTSIFNSTAVLGIGAADGGTASPFSGRVYRAEVRNGLDGTVVANPDFRNLAAGTTSFVDAAGLTWTLQGTAKVV